MKAILACVATAAALAGCHQPEQPPVPPKPTNPTNAIVAYAPADVIDASIVSDAAPPLEAAVGDLDGAIAPRGPGGPR